MSEQLAEFTKTLAELNIKDKRLIYPSSLRKKIEEADFATDPSDKSISFISLYPSASTVLVPVLEKAGELTKNSLAAKPDIFKVRSQLIATPIDCIILPIMPIDDNINCEWTSVEGMGLGNLTEYVKWKLYKMGSGIVSNILPSEAVYSMKQGIFGGGIDNPHDRLAFAGHSRRTFSLGWDFLKPESPEDEVVLSQILSLLRMSALGNYGKYVISPPISWKIEFHSLPSFNPLFVYKRCGFNSVQTKFGGEGEWHAMESGFPFASLTLEVSELDYPDKKDVTLNSAYSGLVTDTLSDLSKEQEAEAKKNADSINGTKKNKS